MMADIGSLMMEAENLVNEREWDQAVEKYRQVIDLEPTAEEAYSKLAELYSIRGLISNVIETYFSLMDILEQKEEFDVAVEVARWIMKVQPENDKARMKTILIYKQKGDMDEVVKQSLALARLYIELGQGDQSILLLKNAQEIAPDNLDIGLELAEMYISHGHIQEGTNQYRKIANAYMAKGEYEKAAEAFRRMKVVIPEDPQLLFTLGNLYMNLGKLNEAESEFRAILRHNLNHTDALMALGEVCQKKGQFRDAILAFNKILSINPQDEKAKERLGELYHAQGATSEAVKHYLQAANAYQYNEETEKAIKLYQRVLNIDPTNPTACRELTNLGAPLVPEGSETEVQPPEPEPVPEAEEIQMGVPEESMDFEGPSLEEMAGIIIPEEENIPGMEGEYAELPEFAEFQEEKPSSVGAIPSAFGTSAPQDFTELKKGLGGELTYLEDEQLSPDLKYDEELDFSNDEMGFAFEEGEDEAFPEDMDEEEDEEYEEEDGKLARRGLRRKDGADGGMLRRGLSKKKRPEKKIMGMRAGMISQMSRKKPSLPRRGAAAPPGPEPGKGLFRRRTKEQEPMEEGEFLDYPEPDMLEPEEMEAFEEPMADFDETAPSFQEMDLQFDETLPPESEMPGVIGEEGFGDLDADLPSLEGEFQPPIDQPELAEEQYRFEEIPMTDEFQKPEGMALPEGDLAFEEQPGAEAPMMDEMGGLEEPSFDDMELPPLDEAQPGSESFSFDDTLMDEEIEGSFEEMPLDESEDEDSSYAPLGKMKKKPLRKLLGKKKGLKKTFRTGKKLGGSKLKSKKRRLGEKPDEDAEMPLGQKRLFRRRKTEEETVEAPIEEPVETAEIPEPIEFESMENMQPMDEWTFTEDELPLAEEEIESAEEQFSLEAQIGIPQKTAEEAIDMPELDLEPPATMDEVAPIPEMETAKPFETGEATQTETPITAEEPGIPDLEGLDEIDMDLDLDLEEMTGIEGMESNELPPMEVPDMEQGDLTMPEGSMLDSMISDEMETSEMLISDSDMAQTLEELENIDIEMPSISDIEGVSDEEEKSPESMPTSYLSEPAGMLEIPELGGEKEAEESKGAVKFSLEAMNLPPEIEEETPQEQLLPLEDEEEQLQAETLELEEEEEEALEVSGTGELGDFGDLLKLADEIENIIPDEDRIKEAEKAQKLEEERRKQEEQEALEQEQLSTSELGEEVEAQSMPTSFFDESEPPDISSELGIEEVAEMPDLEEIAIDTDQLALSEVQAPSTAFLSPEEEAVQQPTGMLDGVEAAQEIEVTETEEAVTAEMVEEIPEPTPPPEVDLKEKISKHLAENNLGRALPVFVEAMEKLPEEMELRKEYANLCYEFGLNDRALESYQLYIEKNPDDVETRKRLIKSQLMSDRIEEAVDHMVTYGNILTSRDEIDEAQRIYQHILALQEENSVAREALSEIYLNLEMKQLALYHLNILAKFLEKQESIDETIKVLKKIYTLKNDIETQEKLANVYINNDYTVEAINELQSLARRYLEREEQTKAAKHYEKIISLDPRNIEAHKMLIDLYESIQEPVKSYNEKVVVADLMNEEGEKEEARTRYEECLKINGNDNEVRRKLVDLYLDIDELDSALEESGILSQVYHKERRYDEAIELYLSLIGKMPEKLSLREKLSEFYIMSDQFEKGLEQLTRVAEEQSSAKDWDAAIKTYRKALNIDTKNADYHFKIGEIYLNYKNNKTEARYEFEKVFELDPAHRKAMEHLVKLYLDEDKPSKAVNVLLQLIELDDSYTSLKEEIINNYKSQIDENPNDYKAHFNLGITYKELQLWKQAIEQFQTTRKSKDYVLESHNMLGICFAQQPPMLNLAVKTLEKGLELKGFDPHDYIELNYNLGTLYEKLKKYNKAAAQYEAVLAVDPHYRDAQELLKNVNKKL